MDEDRARELLATERARIERQLKGLSRRGEDAELAHGDQHLGDEAADLFEDELRVGRIDDLREQLRAVERAEERLASGTTAFPSRAAFRSRTSGSRRSRRPSGRSRRRHGGRAAACGNSHRSRGARRLRASARARSALGGDITNAVDTETWDRLATPPGISSAEEVQRLVPEGTPVVKAFNTTFAPTVVEGEVAGQQLDVLIAGE